MYLQQTQVKNKTALVTGAGKGIGKACAVALAEAGANLIILSRTKSDLDKVEKQITKLKRKCKSYICDVSNYEDVKNVFNKVSSLIAFMLFINSLATGKATSASNKACRIFLKPSSTCFSSSEGAFFKELKISSNLLVKFSNIIHISQQKSH